MAPTPPNKIKQRYEALQLAEAVSNVSKACRQLNFSRTQFYEYKRRFHFWGIEGLKNRQPIHKFHPQTTPPKIVEKIITLSSNKPWLGCNKICDELKTEGINISSPTIQKILVKQNLGKRYQRLLNLADKVSSKTITPTDDQKIFIEKHKHRITGPFKKISRPGDILISGYFPLPESSIQPYDYKLLLFFLDAYCGYAFALIFDRQSSLYFLNQDLCYSILKSKVFSQYNSWGIAINKIIISRQMAKDLFSQNMEIRYPDHEASLLFIGGTNISTYFKRFNETFLKEFWEPEIGVGNDINDRSFNSNASQKKINRWVKHYNEKKREAGYSNYKKTPFKVIKGYLESNHNR
jgi:hypothetical protein